MNIDSLMLAKKEWETSSQYEALPKDGTKVKVLRAGRKEESFIEGAVGIVDGRFMMPVSGVWVRFHDIVALLSYGCHSVGFQGLFPADQWEIVPKDTPLGFDGKPFLRDETAELRRQVGIRGITCYCCGKFKDEHVLGEQSTHKYKADVEKAKALKGVPARIKRWHTRVSNVRRLNPQSDP